MARNHLVEFTTQSKTYIDAGPCQLANFGSDGSTSLRRQPKIPSLLSKQALFPKLPFPIPTVAVALFAGDAVKLAVSYARWRGSQDRGGRIFIAAIDYGISLPRQLP